MDFNLKSLTELGSVNIEELRFVIGTCYMMCPPREITMREREGLLHYFEIDEKTRGLKRPKADPDKTIKAFNRPAAGRNMMNSNDLRPGPILICTIKYLFTKISTREDRDWAMIYDFIFDRTRSIRQDAVIQRLNISFSIQILEPIVRFHVYASQRLCERNISEFDAKINATQLIECLKQLLVLYDEKHRLGKKVQNASEPNLLSVECMDLQNNRSEMEAIYLLINLGNQCALSRYLSLPPEYRQSHEVKLAWKISIAWYLHNYNRTCRLIQQLSTLLKCAAAYNLRKIRRCTLEIMSSAYNSKVLNFPGIKLQEMLLYDDVDKIKEDCKLFGLNYTYDNINFQKANFKTDVLLASPEMILKSRSLHDLLPDILLNGDEQL